MYAHIEGLVAEKSADGLVLDCGGVGYLLSVSRNTLAAAPAVGESMKCYTLLSVREDALELFGFATREEKRMFERLKSVGGVGPRMALLILSALPVRDLSIALVTGDIQALCRVPGIGKKIAQRIILELKDKLAKDQSSFSAQSSGAIPVVLPGDKGGEAAAALAVLGYGSQEIGLALKGIDMDALPLEEIIRQALKKMVR